MSKTYNTPIGPNLGWLYYKHYFNDLSTDKVKNKNSVSTNTAELVKQPLPSGMMLTLNESKAPWYSFRLKTTYPGLVTGIGMKHETGHADGELKLGFSFDHTTGVPYVAGSGVKGKLRSFFTHADYLLYVVETELELTLERQDFNILEMAIFDGKSADGQRLGPYRCDTFLDAFAVGVLRENTNDRTFLVKDSITHHPHPLKSPNPVQFLVVGPEVLFQFAFRLFPTLLTKGQTFSAEHKYKLFRHLLLEHGVGAKTNVGYGQFMIP